MTNSGMRGESLGLALGHMMEATRKRKKSVQTENLRNN
jgi:hypothetical protein